MFTLTAQPLLALISQFLWLSWKTAMKMIFSSIIGLQSFLVHFQLRKFPVEPIIHRLVLITHTLRARNYCLPSTLASAKW